MFCSPKFITKRALKKTIIANEKWSLFFRCASITRIRFVLSWKSGLYLNTFFSSLLNNSNSFLYNFVMKQCHIVERLLINQKEDSYTLMQSILFQMPFIYSYWYLLYSVSELKNHALDYSFWFRKFKLIFFGRNNNACGIYNLLLPLSCKVRNGT